MGRALSGDGMGGDMQPEEVKGMSFRNSNQDARIRVRRDQPSALAVDTAYRDPGTLCARADVRERYDVETGRSLTGLSVRTAGGRSIRFTGAEARTLYRVLDAAVNG